MTNEEFIESIRLENEEWRDVVGYEGIYIVSSIGRIAVLERSMLRKNRWGRISPFLVKPHVCSTSISPSSWYRKVSFMLNGKRDTRLLHRIVAEAFLPNPNNYPQVDHINDDPTDNRVENLQWCTSKMNNSKEHHRKASSIAAMGRVDPKRKPIVAIDENGNYTHFESMFAANKQGHNNSAMLRVLRGQLHTHHGLRWMYLSDFISCQNSGVKELSQNG